MRGLAYVLVLLAATCCALAPRAASAQTAPTQIELRVVDAAGKPLADARVFVTGPAITSALTPADGTVRFDDVPAGVYRFRVVRAGYDGVDVDDVEALAGRRRLVEITLVRSQPRPAGTAPPAPAGQLKEIGRVVARPAVSLSTVEVDEGNPLRRVSENLVDALDKIAGVSVAQQSQSGTLTISLRNQDPGRTLASVGGAPILGGGAPQLQQVAGDLATGASVDGSSFAGNLGGAVNFRTLEPTKTFQTQFSSSYGSYEHSFAQLALSGSAHKLGFAAQHVVRGGGDKLTGLSFTDTSGETYAHDGAYLRTANILKLRYALSPRLTFEASYVGGSARSSPVCDDDTTVVPCGYGPGNETDGHSRQGGLRLQSQIGNVALIAGVYGNGYASTVDRSAQVLAGTREPFRLDTAGGGLGFYGFGKLGERRHTFSLAVGRFRGDQRNAALGAFQHPTSGDFRYGYAQLGDEFKASERWSYAFNGGTTTSNGGSGLALNLALTLRPSRQEDLTLGFGVGANGVAFNGVGTFADPSTATYNCSGDAVRVSGPNDPARGDASSDAELTYQRRGRRGTLRIAGYDRLDRDGLLSAQFPLVGLPAGTIPPGYLDAIRTIWSRDLICGARPFDPGRVFVAESVGGPTVRYRGVDLSGQLALGRAVVAIPSYSIAGARLESADARLLVPGSLYFVGAQLPFRPLHRAGLTLDAQPHGPFEYLFDARWTAANNSDALTSYVQCSAGITWTARRGRLTLLETNMFQADTGLFAGREFAQPLALRAGGTYLPVPTLLPPRAFTLLYSVRSGRLR